MYFVLLVTFPFKSKFRCSRLPKHVKKVNFSINLKNKSDEYTKIIMFLMMQWIGEYARSFFSKIPKWHKFSFLTSRNQNFKSGRLRTKMSTTCSGMLKIMSISSTCNVMIDFSKLESSIFYHPNKFRKFYILNSNNFFYH